MLRKNADRFCQHPYFVMASEPRVMSATGTAKFGYNTMPLKGRRAQSNYSVNKRGKKRKTRLMTAGHNGRQRSAVGSLHKNNRPITAKAPVIGRRLHKTQQEDHKKDDGTRPETVPFTNIGPLGETEPADENDKIKQEITREVTGESEKEIEARINNELEDRDASDPGESPPHEDKFNEKEKQLDNLTDDLSNNQDKHKSDPENDENNDPNNDESNNAESDIKHRSEHEPQHIGTTLDKIEEKPLKENEVVEQPDTGAEPHKD